MNVNTIRTYSTTGKNSTIAVIRKRITPVPLSPPARRAAEWMSRNSAADAKY